MVSRQRIYPPYSVVFSIFPNWSDSTFEFSDNSGPKSVGRTFNITLYDRLEMILTFKFLGAFLAAEEKREPNF